MLGDDRPVRPGMGQRLHLPVPPHDATSTRRPRAIFAGDAAHQVSPFGARGANSGIQDTDDLIWKLKLVMDGKAPETLLDTYSDERTLHAADENILNSTRSTDFITPKSRVSKTFRNAVLDLAQDHAFARRLVNSGAVGAGLPDAIRAEHAGCDTFAGDMVPGAPMDDAPIQVGGQDAWLLDQLGNRFQLLVLADSVCDH
jgi:3-(3-hydroxy-phenyl)propionate hydroxylase